jgi:acetyl-CoA acyltransferase
MKSDVYILDAVRTPIGKRDGTYKNTRSDDLGAAVLRAVVERNRIEPKQIDDVIAGCVTQVGEQGLNIARNVALAAGLPVEVGGTSVNRLCGSGLQAVNFGAAAIAAGTQDLVVALGTESMSRVAMGSDGGSLNPKLLERFGIVNQGVSAELIAEKWSLGREVVDQFSLASHKRAVAASEAGRFAREIVPYAGLSADETPRRDTSLEKLASLRPSFKEGGVITAGNSSQISDGAAAVLLASGEKAKSLGLRPRARIVASAVIGVDPTLMLAGPIPATQRALARAGLQIGDIDVIECNEAFAPVPLAFARELGVDAERLNPRGGAIALGHPLGATGARLVTTLLHTLEDEKKRYGLVTLCIGFGQGIATIIERI